MFGGFGPEYFSAYHELIPKSDPVEEYEDRIELYTLYDAS
jgi:protein-ribulosamine 3-kinase